MKEFIKTMLVGLVGLIILTLAVKYLVVTLALLIIYVIGDCIIKMFK